MTVSLPEDFKDANAFIERMHGIYGEVEGDRILAGMSRSDSTATYWFNPLKPTSVSLPGDPLAGLVSVFVCADRDAITRSEAATAGHVYVQNASSYYAVSCLRLETGMEVLDLAAAPGGKTIAIAALLNNTGRIAAVEPIVRRFHRLRSNLERCGATNVAYYQKDGRGVGRAVPELFDRVLVDAPCSSEARMRWDNVDSYKHWQLRKLKETRRKQKALIMSGYQALKPGGLLLYCTCSFAPEENELVVKHLLKRTDAEVDPLDFDAELPLHSGLTEWQGRKLGETLAGTARVVPVGVWEGFYLARIRKPPSNLDV
ncbi:MAG: RsmB/NOP family class I SAM-dependent RNA methyltransferase [Pseudomonadales bacterium]|nr:RsmB/NOP family class I SAM-dependent RNA methyltransferase [Pseudomonadales bacterium]